MEDDLSAVACMPSMTDNPFLIAGGGIAGLAAALGLARSGRPSHLFEQAPAFEEVGAGLQMSPNAVRALQWLGAWEAVAPACVIPSEIHVRDALTGAILQRLRLGKPFEATHGAPYRVCHRADLLAGLVRAARHSPHITLHTGTRATAMTATDGGASLSLADGRVARGAGVIAADGIRSTLRSMICGEVRPLAAGHTIYRALIPFPAVPPGIEADCVTLWLAPGAHVVHYPVSNWRQFNIVAAINGNRDADGWSTPAETRELKMALADVAEPLAELLGVPTRWLKWPAMDLPSLPRWSQGPLVLMGDAAHATLPYLAQGAAMALEDACVLGSAISTDQPAAAFAAFARARMARTARIRNQSRRQARIYHADGILALARNAALRLAGNHLLRRQTDWIYRWQPPGQ